MKPVFILQNKFSIFFARVENLEWLFYDRKSFIKDFCDKVFLVYLYLGFLFKNMWVEIYSMRNNNSYISKTVVKEIIIGAPKILNNFWCTVELSVCSLLLFFLLLLPLSYHFSNFALAKVIALNLFATFHRFCALIYGLFSVLFPL